MIYLLAAAMGGIAIFLWYWGNGYRLSPDGQFYLRAGAGLEVPRPYSFRWLLPMLGGNQPRRWAWITLPSLILCCPLIADIVPGEPWQKLVAVGLFVGLTIFRLGVFFPVLVDGPAMLLTLGATACALRGLWWLALPLSVVAGACKESAPLFVSIFTLSPLYLLGLAGMGWWRKAGKPSEPWLERPIAEARRVAIGGWQALLLPWGAIAVLAPLGVEWDRWTLSAGLALAAGYGQLFFAQDKARLYQWGFLPLLVLAVRAVSVEWLLLALIWHWGNPYRGV